MNPKEESLRALLAAALGNLGRAKQKIASLESENADLWQVIHKIAAGDAAPHLSALAVVTKYKEPK